MGLRLRAEPFFAGLALIRIVGPRAEAMPPFYKGLSSLLLEVARLGLLDEGRMDLVQSLVIYRDFVSTPPPPKIVVRMPDLPWWLAWGRLAIQGLPGQAVDVAFMALHNILPLQVRRFRMGLVGGPDCESCGGEEDVFHFFVSCPRVMDAWAYLAWRANLALGGFVGDERLLFLMWPPSVEDFHVAMAVLTFMELAWEGRESNGAVGVGELRARVKARAVGPFRSIC